MATIEASIQAALFGRVASLVLTPAHEIAWPNVNFPGKLPNGQDKPKPARYLRVTHFPNTTDRFAVGSDGANEHKGILQVMVCAPLNTGEAAARETAGMVASHFPADLCLDQGGVRVRISKRADIASMLVTDTEIQIPVSIRYEALI